MAENQREKRGRLFRKAVESLGLDSPVTEISEALGYDKGNLSKVLNNKIQPSTTLIKDFQRVYRVNIADFDIPKEKTSPGEARFEDLIAKKVYDMLLPVLEGCTENILKAIMDLHIELNEIKINQEETLETQKKCTEEQEQAGKILEKIGKNF